MLLFFILFVCLCCFRKFLCHCQGSLFYVYFNRNKSITFRIREIVHRQTKTEKEHSKLGVEHCYCYCVSITKISTFARDLCTSPQQCFASRASWWSLDCFFHVLWALNAESSVNPVRLVSLIDRAWLNCFSANMTLHCLAVLVVLGSSGGVVNSLGFCLALLKSLGCFSFRCVLSS